jgi:hypothetical protein
MISEPKAVTATMQPGAKVGEPEAIEKGVHRAIDLGTGHPRPYQCKCDLAGSHHKLKQLALLSGWRCLLRDNLDEKSGNQGENGRIAELLR